MNPAVIMAIATGAQAVGTLIGGIAAKRTADLQAFNIKTESILSRAQAMQQTRLRYNELKEALSAADTFFMGVANRDISDASIRAMKEKDIEVSSEDISDIEAMSRLTQLKYRTEALATRRKGRESLLASIITAGSTAAQGYQDFTDAQ